MTNQKLKLKDLKAIKVTHVMNQEETRVFYISYNQFENSFINERWEGERRTGATYTIFGKVHTKTTVTSPYDGEKSIRTFEFPSDYESALKIHNENC